MQLGAQMKILLPWKNTVGDTAWPLPAGDFENSKIWSDFPK